jgi:hypothetical protein
MPTMVAAFPPQADNTTRPLRLALISSPHPGTAWLRRMMAVSYELAEVFNDEPADIGWSALPDSCVLALHWPREPDVEQRLTNAGFRLIVVGRHPFDVLASSATRADVDSSVAGRTPASDAFLRYALGQRAGQLVDISRQWWSHPEAYRVRYEDLMADATSELDRIARTIGLPDQPDGRQRRGAVGPAPYGSPGRWRELIPTGHLTELYCRYLPHLSVLGYPVEVPGLLSQAQAEANWFGATGLARAAPARFGAYGEPARTAAQS